MYNQEKIKPYNSTDEKGKVVEEMFDNIAPTYDTLNHRLSWNIDKSWRKKAIKELSPFKPKTILDNCNGDWRFCYLSAKMLLPDTLIGADISEDDGNWRQKVKNEGLEGIISFQKEDCLNLTFPSDTFEAVTAAFGIRNFQDLERGLVEMYRVLKKGGQFCAL